MFIYIKSRCTNSKKIKFVYLRGEQLN